MSKRRSSSAFQAKDSASLFAALGDETRLRLVLRLGGREPMSIASLTAGSTITRQAITKHLRVMEQAGLVRGKWHGRERLWRLEQRRFNDARHYLDLVSRQWDEALGRLRSFIED